MRLQTTPLQMGLLIRTGLNLKVLRIHSAKLCVNEENNMDGRRTVFFLVATLAIFTLLASPVAAESDPDTTGIVIGVTEKGHRDVYYPAANGYLWLKMDLQETTNPRKRGSRQGSKTLLLPLFASQVSTGDRRKGCFLEHSTCRPADKNNPLAYCLS